MTGTAAGTWRVWMALCWTLCFCSSRRARGAQKRKFGGEFFASSWEATGSEGDPFLRFFQQTRDGRPKGIVVL